MIIDDLDTVFIERKDVNSKFDFWVRKVGKMDRSSNFLYEVLHVGANSTAIKCCFGLCNWALEHV